MHPPDRVGACGAIGLRDGDQGDVSAVLSGAEPDPPLSGSERLEAGRDRAGMERAAIQNLTVDLPERHRLRLGFVLFDGPGTILSDPVALRVGGEEADSSGMEHRAQVLGQTQRPAVEAQDPPLLEDDEQVALVGLQIDGPGGGTGFDLQPAGGVRARGRVTIGGAQEPQPRRHPFRAGWRASSPSAGGPRPGPWAGRSAAGSPP